MRLRIGGGGTVEGDDVSFVDILIRTRIGSGGIVVITEINSTDNLSGDEGDRLSSGSTATRRDDRHHEALAYSGVVSGGCQITVRTAVGHRDRDVGGSGLSGDRRKSESA